jgi:hypothetical protein
MLRFLGVSDNGYRDWACEECRCFFSIRFEDKEAERIEGDPAYCPKCNKRAENDSSLCVDCKVRMAIHEGLCARCYLKM